MFTEDYCIWDSKYVENNSLRELQPPQLKTICCVLSLFKSLLHVLYVSTLLSFFFFLFSLLSFFSLLFFFLMLFVNVHKISIRPSLCPNNFFFLSFFFFLHKIFDMVTFPPFRLMCHSIFSGADLGPIWQRSPREKTGTQKNIFLGKTNLYLSQKDPYLHQS